MKDTPRPPGMPIPPPQALRCGQNSRTSTSARQGRSQSRRATAVSPHEQDPKHYEFKLVSKIITIIRAALVLTHYEHGYLNENH